MCNLLTSYPPSPLQPLQTPLLEEKGIRLLIKRDNLLQLDNKAVFCGNKWRKLKYNLLKATELSQNKLLTFGGAYSNHLAAVAQAGQLFDFQTIGIVRGEAHFPLNPTLRFCVDCGMELHYISRTEYHKKQESNFIFQLQQQFGDFYLLPEGGTNDLAMKGCREIVIEIEQQMDSLPDYIAVACGTGGTLAGIAAELNGRSQAIGFSVLKGMTNEVTPPTGGVASFITLQNDYHFGGYAKFTPELIRFINDFKTNHDLALDPIYTGKLFLVFLI